MTPNQTAAGNGLSAERSRVAGVRERTVRSRAKKLLVLSCAVGFLFLLTALLAPYEVRVVSSSIPIPERRIALSPLFVPPVHTTEAERSKLVMGGPGASIQRSVKLQWRYLLVEWVGISVLSVAGLFWVFRSGSQTDQEDTLPASS